MKQIGKVTVKHYLNINLKQYVVRGESYFSIYILITVNRKSTKVKSISFEELYTEKDFEDILNKDNDLIKQECRVIENISTMIVEFFGGFDANVFSSYYSMMNDLFIDSIDFESISQTRNFWNKNNNRLQLGLESFVFGNFSLSVNKTHGMSLFIWFSEKGQKELPKYLKKEKIHEKDIIDIINRIVFLGSMKEYSFKLNQTHKGKDIYKRYSTIIDNEYEFFYDDISKKFSPNL